MSLTYGFYNSLNGDRTYNAEQMSSIFDGIIKDGIFASIGTCFVVTADGEDNTINVGIGRAWFNHTWTYNDAILPLEAPDSELLLDRIDAVVLEVDATETVRANAIKIIEGTPSSSPERPALTNDTDVHQYPLCYIARTANSSVITQSDITNMVGTDDTPFITGILEVISLDTLLGQWQDELNQFVSNEESDFAAWYAGMIEALEAALAEINTWGDSEKATILEWFEAMKDQLSEDAAVNLQLQIDSHVIENILMIGLPDGEKTFSDDGTVITTVNDSGLTLTKTFTDGFLTCTTVLTDSNGSELGSLIKTFSSDGKVIDSVISIV